MVLSTTENRFEPPFGFAREAKWIQRFIVLTQAGLFFAAELAAGQQTLVSRLRLIIAPFPPTALAPLFDQLHRRQKEVVQRAPSFLVQRINRRDQALVLQAAVAEQWSRPHPILLFHVRVVILVIRPGTRQPDGPRTHLQIPNERPIEPFAAVVEIKSDNGKSLP